MPDNEEKIKQKLEVLRKKEEEESAKIIAGKFKLPYIDLSIFPIELDALKILPEEKARSGELAIIQAAGKRLKIAVRNPQKGEARGILEELSGEGYAYELFLASKSGLEHALDYYRKVPQWYEAISGSIQISQEKVSSLRRQIEGMGEITERIEKTFSGRTTEALEIILAGALAVEASDVHLEPQQEEKTRLRFRLDGVLHDLTSIPSHLYHLLLSRIKLVSELKLNIHDRAQDGRLTLHLDETDIEVRVSTLPGPYGENVVMRILNPKTIGIPFENLGMQPWIIKTMEAELKKPNGMILTTGPTGSGKTTTLYAFLRKVYNEGIKVITVEDPIEYHLAGIEQTQIDAEKGYDFANALRSVVRQDPDVILVGEIRDLETAETAMHAALTGHLVFSTLHTNSAAGTIPRLLDLGVKPSIIAPAINVTMAQRLVRKLCKQCRVKKDLSAGEKNKIKEELDAFPENIPVPEEKTWEVFSAGEKGCRDCSGTGYRGRSGVSEIILIDEKIEHLILKEPSEFEIKKEALRQGQITMKQDGLLKTLAGITDFAEVERVVGAD